MNLKLYFIILFIIESAVVLCDPLSSKDIHYSGSNSSISHRGRNDIWSILHRFTTPQLLSDILKKHSNYKNRLPFPHMVDNTLFSEELLKRVIKEIPDNPKLRQKGCVDSSSGNCYSDQHQIYKNGIEKEIEFGSATSTLFSFLKSSMFVEFLESLTGIKNLIADPHYYGSGIHQSLSGGHLDIHSDFNYYERYNLHRRVNILLYLNEDWKEEYGGHLELWSRDMKQCNVRVKPDLGQLVIFSSTDFSYHGHPEPLKCPENRSRRSLAMYYYSSTRPSNECLQDNCDVRHSTLWQPTPCKCSETQCQHFIQQD